MASKKREIYARAAVQLRTNERPLKAELLCPGAMGLYFFLLLDARGEASSGDVSELVAIASWGGKPAYRAKQIDALAAVGLVERRDGRVVILKYDEHNDTPSEIDLARAAARGRKRKARGHADVTRDIAVSHAEVPISSSLSISSSGSRSPGEGAGRGPPSGLRLVSDRPPWFDATVESAEMSTGETFDRGVVWTSYFGSRTSDGRALSVPDLLRFLGSWAAKQKDQRQRAPLRSVRPQDVVQPEIPGSWSMPSEMP